MSADATSADDGLAELQAARLARQKRRPPKPRHPRIEPPPEVGEDSPPVVVPSARAQSVERSGPARGREVAGPAGRGSGVDEDGPLTLVQIRLTAGQLEYLDEIDAVAATRRLDVTDAAVMRLALRELMEANTPEEIVSRLGQPKVRGRRGRPRH